MFPVVCVCLRVCACVRICVSLCGSAAVCVGAKQEAEYVHKLMRVFTDCKEMEDTASLKLLARLFKCISEDPCSQRHMAH